MANNVSITPLIPTDIKSILSQVGGFIPAFDSQLVDSTKQKLILGAQNIAKNQGESLINLAKRQQQAGINRNNTIRKAEKDFKNKKITEEQYNIIITNANASYEAEKLAIEENKQQIQQSRKKGVNDFQKNVDDKLKVLKKENVKAKSNTLKTKVKSKAELAKNVLTNPANLTAIYPALSLLITNAFLNFITQRKRLEKQVDAVNFYIDTQVVDETSVIIATNLKNNTIKAINDAIAKLKAIEGILKTINNALKIASVALKVLGVLLALLPAVPGAVLKVFEILNKVINGLSSIISPCIRILSNEIQKLKELIEKLKQIVLKLNKKTLDILTDDQLLKLIETILPVGSVTPFQTLTAVPVSGSAGFVDIGGRIVPLNSTSAAGSLPQTTVSGVGTAVTGALGGTGGGVNVGGIGTGGIGTGAGGAGTGTGVGIGAGGGATGAETGIGVGTGGGIGIGAVGTPTTGTLGGIGGGGGTGAVGGNTAGTGSGIGNANNLINPPTISTPSTVNTSNTGTTNGTGLGLTTTGGTGNGGVNVGPAGVIPNNNVLPTSPTVGSNIGLDSGVAGIPLENQSIFPINLDQLALEGLDEIGLEELEQTTLEILTQEDPSLSQQQQSELKQVPSINDQANLYKGFRFQIKEEQDPKFTVRGTIKRRYAVAINKLGVEVLKSEYSFTLDPNDLVDQLKLVIDKRKLQG